MCRAQAINFPGMLDTGSQRSLMKNSLFQKLKHEINPSKNGQPSFLFTASGAKMPVLGCATINFHIDGLEFSHDFIIVEGYQ